MAGVILPNVPGAFKMVMKGTVQSMPFVNTWYASHGAGNFDQAALNAIAAGMASAYWASYKSILSTQTAHVTTQAIDLSSRTAGFGSDSTANQGTLVGTDYAPVNVALCISHTIQDRYRGGHPRMYLPFPLLGQIQGGKNINPTFLNTVKTAATAFRSAVNALTAGGTTWTLVCVRYYDQKLLLTQPLIRPITQMVVHNRIDSMRRRTGKEVA